MHSKINVTHLLLGFIALLGLAAFSVPASAATYYVRTDGGTNVQCNGTVNAPYPGSGTGQACAWNNLMQALPPNYLQAKAALIAGGDTVIIAPGSYPEGWQPGLFAQFGDNCAAQYAAACHPQPIPSGTPTNPTQILGAGWNTGCAAPPELWGTEGANYVLSLDGSSNVVIACLSVTDHSDCTLGYSPNAAYKCVAKATGTGDNDPGLGQWAMKGIHAQDSGNVTLQDVDIHGMADQGVQAGRISNWTVTRVKVRGNGNVGWNGDLGGNNHSSTNSGTLTFTDLEVLWNGCAEQYPVDGTYINCYGQNEGGYGDGFGEAWSGGNFVFIRPVVKYNMQDGLDLLYANGTGSVTVDRGYFLGNMGNDLKTSGNSTVTNSIFINYCNALQNSGMPIAGNGQTGTSGTMCRAGGGQLQDFTDPGQTIVFAFNTVTGDGGCLYGGDQNFHSHDGPQVPVSSSDTYQIQNNIFVAQPSALPSIAPGYACVTYFNNGAATVQYVNNLVWHGRNLNCSTPGIICKDPQLVNESLANFYAYLLPSSPASGNASSAYTTAFDFYGMPRACGSVSGCTIGAVEYRGQPYLGGDTSPVPPLTRTGPGSTSGSGAKPIPNVTSGTSDPMTPLRIDGGGSVRIRAPNALQREHFVAYPRAWSIQQQPRVAPVQQASDGGYAQAQPAADTPAANARAVPDATSSGSRSQPVRLPYLVVVYDWFADIYDRFVQQR